jgi:hypothetical protein
MNTDVNAPMDTKFDYRSIETNLPSRFQIRRLEEKDTQHALAITIHSLIFHSPIHSVTNPEVG